MTTEVCLSSDAFPVGLGVALLENPTIKAPTFVFTNKPFSVTGTTPEPNQSVWIEIEKTLIDEKIATGVSDAERNFEIEITLEKIGYVKIHSEVEKFGLNPTSQSHGIIVVDMWILGLVGVVLVYIAYTKGWLKGIMKKGRKK